MPERQLCLFEGDRPSWRSLEAATHEELLRLVGELLIEAVQKHCEEEASDERQDHA
jgi:hypothetical protein